MRIVDFSLAFIPGKSHFIWVDVYARVVEQVDTGDLKSPGLQRPCRFDSGLGHYIKTNGSQQNLINIQVSEFDNAKVFLAAL